MQEINVDISLKKTGCEAMRKTGWQLKHEMTLRGSREGEAADVGEKHLKASLHDGENDWDGELK